MLMLAPTPRAAVPDFVRAVGGVRVLIGRTPRGSAPLEIGESGGFRVRFPHADSPGEVCQGVLINTGGGLTGGDRVSTEAVVTPDARGVLTTQAAEKVYRSDGPDAEAAVALTLGAGSRLDWLPQETILFDGARLRRRLAVEMAADAALLLVESTVFGRAAMGETVETGFFRDRWRIRRDGRLVFAEEVRLEGPIAAALARPAVANGGRAVATCLVVAPGAEDRLDEARAALEGARSECGVSAYDGMLVARFLSPEPRSLRADLIRYTETLRGPLPRSWQT
jgi:urease accessory protein